MAAEPESIRLVHVTTVPISLLVLVDGQFGYMQSRGLEVHGLSSGGELAERVQRELHVPVHVVEMERRITPLKDLVALYRIWRILRRVRPHIVHSHTPKGGLLGMIGAWLAGVPVRIYHIRGLRYITATSAQKRILVLSEKLACRLANQVLCVSHSIREVAIAEKLCDVDKIKVPLGGSGNGIDATKTFNPARFDAATPLDIRRQFGIPEDSLVIGYVGRIVRDKGLVELTGAWRQLRDDFPNLHLLLVGPFEPQDPLPADIELTLRGDPRIHLAGFLQPEQIAPVYLAMDVFVLPSYREGFPNTLLEAAAMQLPVVSTRIPGCSDAAEDGVTATLVPVRDTQALARAIRRYLDDPGLRSTHGKAGRERVLRDFQQARIWEWIYEEYRSLLAQHHLV